MARRPRLLSLLLLGAALLCAAPAAAQDDAPLLPDEQGFIDGRWPRVELDPAGTGDAHSMVRGPGRYLSTAKIVFAWLLFLLWVWTTDWVSRDCAEHRLNYVLWNSAVFFPFFVCFLLMWKIPMFLIGFTLLVLAYGGPLGGYIYLRNQEVDAHDRVLTPDHFRAILARKAKKVGVKIDTTKKAAHEKGAPVELAASGNSDADKQALLIKARQLPGFVPAKDLLADALDRRSAVAMMDFTATGVSVRHQIDGLWHPADPREREEGDAILVALKSLSALKPEERRRKQAGVFHAGYNGANYKCRLVSQGTESGERVVIALDEGSARFKSLEDLGMREKMAEVFKEQIGSDAGMILFSSLPSGGLTTTIDVALDITDRLMRGFVAIEEKSRREREIENVEVKTYDAAAGESPLAILPKVIREYPDVLVIRDLVDAETVKFLCDQVGENRLVISGIRAKEAPEALLRVLMLKAPPEDFADAVTCVLNQRLVRVLCNDCRVATQATPEMLNRLGIPPGKVQTLYREPKGSEVDKPCKTCRGIGFLGRTSIFELLVVDDKVRHVLKTQPKLESVRQAARAAGMKTLQEEGILLVAKGITSLNELTRVLKQ